MRFDGEQAAVHSDDRHAHDPSVHGIGTVEPPNDIDGPPEELTSAVSTGSSARCRQRRGLIMLGVRAPVRDCRCSS
jgi:hypothetical protein